MIGNKNYWGKGIGTESIWCVAKYSFEVLKLNKIIASMYETNIGSYKSFLKVGFNEVGRCKNHYLCDGSYIDKFIVELFNNEIMKI